MDSTREVWKSIVLKHASLKFDKNETEVQHQHKTDDLKKLKSTISESYSKNKELKSDSRAQTKYFESVKTSISLLKSSEESLTKEKNDLLKQLELQRIKTGEDKKDQDATLLKYQIMWDQLLSGFHEIPSVKKKLNLEVERKKLEIELREKEMDLRNLRSKIEQFVGINDRRFQITFIKFADAWLNKKKEFLRNKEIQKQSHKRKEELEQKTDHSRETQTTTSTVMNIDKNTLPTTVAADTMNTINNMMIDLRDISFASLVPNEGESLLKFKELQKELSMDNLLDEHFLTSCESNQENDLVSLRHQNLNESSKIPVLNKMDHKLASEKSLNSMSNVVAKKLNHINDIRNSIKPSKIVSPKNSKIPIVTSPVSKEKEFLVPENPVGSRTVRINTSSSLQSAQIRPHYSPMVTSTRTPINFPKSNFGNNPSALKRKLESPSSPSSRVLQKVSRNENNTINCSSPRKKFNVEQIKQLNASNSKTKMVESNFKGVKNLKNVEQQNAIRNDEQTIVEDDENNMVEGGLDRTGENLNATYTLEEACGEEQIECNETEENVEATDLDAANVPEDETVSKYFQETCDDKENAPPQDTVQNIISTNAGFFEEVPQDQNFSYEGNEFSENILFSPPRDTEFSSTTQVQDPPGDDFAMFENEIGKVTTSSPTSQENTDGNNPSPTGFGSFFFKSRPKKRGLGGLF